MVSYRVLMTGSRTWGDIETIKSAFASAERENEQGWPITLIHGAAAGADTIAAMVAKEMGWNIEAHPAEWETHTYQCPAWHLDLKKCKMAGHRRNAEMVNSRADICFAFIKDHSKGATACAKLAAAAGIPTIIYEED